jgi:hypothetical protein
MSLKVGFQDQMLGTEVHRQQATVKNITEKNTSGISG